MTKPGKDKTHTEVTMNESKELRTLRLMAWARAKGELESILSTYWDGDDLGRYAAAYKLINEFTTAAEDDGVFD